MFFQWLALNVFYVLKALNPPEWLVDEGKKRRCEERDPPGLVTPIYWPGDPPICQPLWQSATCPVGTLLGPWRQQPCGSAQPMCWENTPRGSLTAHTPAEKGPDPASGSTGWLCRDLAWGP